MLTRALIVLLVVLNLGVALWWMLRPATPDPAHDPAVAGAPLLELLAVSPPAVDAARGGPVARSARPPAVADACHRYGPYADADRAAAAMAGLEPQVVLARLRREWPGAGDSWRIFLAAADVDAAVAAAERIDAAGFDDYYVVREGVDAGIVALGLYRTRSRADTRATALRNAGFEVRVEPVGGGDPEYWVEIAAPAGFDAAAAAAPVAASRVEPRACDGLVAMEEAGPG